MNRYTQLTPSQFSPLSLEEIMLVPSMKRQQHNDILAKQEIIRGELAKVDPLDVHLDEAVKLREEMNNKLTAQAEQLANSGIDPNTQGQFLALNREYQNLTGPTGRLGQINQAKKVYHDNMKTFLEDAQKAGYSREDALRNWQNEMHTKYTGYDDPTNKTNIVNIGQYGAPKRLVLQEDLKFVSGILGEQTKTLMRNNGFSWSEGPNGSIIVKDGKGRLVQTDNIPQLEEAQDYLNSRWNTQNGEGAISAKFEGISPNRIVNEINSGLRMMTKIKQEDNREDDHSIQGYKNPLDIETQDPSGMIISNDSTLTTDALNETNYQDVIKNINQLQSSKNLSSAERAKLEDLKELKTIADAKISKDPEYIKTYNGYKQELDKWKTLANKMNLSKEEKDEISKNPNILPQLLFSKGIGSFKGDKKDKDLNLIMNDESISKFNKLNEDKEKIQNKYWKESSSLRHNYSYMPSTPKEESAWNLHNENVFNTLNGISDLGNVLDLTSIHTTGGSRKDLNHQDVKNIQNLLKSGDVKSFKINNVKTYGDNKTPEITMTFNTKKGAKEYDVDGSWDWNDEYGGEEKPVTVTFKLKKFSNSFDTGSAAGYKNLTGAIANFWKDKGGVNEITGNFQGAEVYNSMIENAYSDISNEELYQRAQVDSDAREALMIRIAKRKSK